MHTYIHTYIHTHTHTYICICIGSNTSSHHVIRKLPARPGLARASSPARPSGHGEARDERPERGMPGVSVHGVLAAVDPPDRLARVAQQRLAAVRSAVLPAVHEDDARAARAQRLPPAHRSHTPARLPSACPTPSCPRPPMNNTVLWRHGLHPTECPISLRDHSPQRRADPQSAPMEPMRARTAGNGAQGYQRDQRRDLDPREQLPLL